jgi:hypothetical protein
VSVATSRHTIADDQSEVTTPRIRTTLRRALFWIGAVVFVALIVLAIVALTGTSPSTARLSASNPKSVGAKALVEVLRTDGVTVHTPHTLSAAIGDLGSGADPAPTTLVVYDRNSILSRGQLLQLAGAENIILIEPSYDALRALAPTVNSAGYVPSTASANCSFGPAQKAGTVAGLGKGYRTPARSDSGPSIRCFGRDDVYSLVRTDTGSGTVTVLGSATLLDNDSILRSGNAALSLGLFGQTRSVVWYLPSFADYSVAQDGIIPLPPWVTLMFTLAGFVLVAAAVWRGRRLGPVVVERMPVVVRASETVEGRARLYQKASARTHAIDALRIGTLSRLARQCGLPKRASLDDVVGTVANVTGRPILELRALLVDDAPATDTQFMRLSDELLRLEADVAVATRPS